MLFWSFTRRANGIARDLESDVGIGPPIDDPSSTDPDEASSRAKNYTAIWDTGATGSVVSQRVIDECGLVPIAMANVRQADGRVILSPVYRASILLTNRVLIPVVHVVRGQPGECDVLIGMEVIGSGDFAVSSDHGRTVFSFRHPSAGPIDFVKQDQTVKTVQKVGRNSRCPCGSGLKYKKCCGRKA